MAARRPAKPVRTARCIDCGRRRWGRFLRCESCQRDRFSAAMTGSWKRRKRSRQIAEEARQEAAQEPGATALPDLEKLMAEADAAAGKALETARRIAGQIAKKEGK